MSDIKLPELPQWCQWDETVADMSTFDIQDAMQDYARAAVLADRADRSEAPTEHGPWTHGVVKSDGRVFMQSDDFTHDVRLYVDGDFADQDQKISYAKMMQDRLNAHPASVPSDELESVEDMAHRMCLKYMHSTDPDMRMYTFGKLTLHDFAHALLAKYGNVQELTHYKAEIARLNKQIHALADALDFGADLLIDSDAAEDAARLFALANNFYIKGPDDDGLLWLVLRGNGTSGQAMFNLGGAEGVAGQVALMLEQDRCAAIDAARRREME